MIVDLALRVSGGGAELCAEAITSRLRSNKLMAAVLGGLWRS